jgi:hypothetical protein
VWGGRWWLAMGVGREEGADCGWGEGGRGIYTWG